MPTSPDVELAGAALVGVVMPARNADRWIKEALRSLQDQSFTGWVCVVVDDGSTDSTAELVEQIAADDPRVRLVREHGRGVSAARNAGLDALPACRYVGFLDSDDLYLPDAIALLVSALEARPDAVGAYGLADYIDERGRRLAPGLHAQRQRWRRQLQGRRLVVQGPTDDVTFETLVADDPVWPAAVALHRMYGVDGVGGFDTSLLVLEDWDLHLRLARRGPYVALDRNVALYRRHDANLTSQHHEIEYHRELVRRSAWLSSAGGPHDRETVVTAWRLLERRQVLVLGRHALRSVARRRWGSATKAVVGLVVAGVGSIRRSPPRASRRRTRLTRPDDLLDVPL